MNGSILLMFSRRTRWDLTPNALAQRKARLEREGKPFLDLTDSNPTRAGICYPEGLLAALAHPRALRYEPVPKGWLRAREAVASLFEAKGCSIDPARIVLTASTSEAYTHLFRLLTDTGDDLLIPQPSYPLFDYLADLNDIRPVPYRLRLSSQGRWELDAESLRRAVSERIRACVVVHPNNPTGSCFSEAERDETFRICRERGWSLISDEVFAEYLFHADSRTPSTLLGSREVLVFCLGGLSKWMGLPQMKLGWIAVSGPEPEVTEALARLEMIADTALSVNTAVQMALPEWLAFGPAIQSQIRHRIQANRERLQAQCLREGRIQVLPSRGGWYAVLRLPGVEDEERWAADLLEQRHVLIHPGYLFDFEGPGFMVISLLPPEQDFAEGIRRLLDFSSA